MNQQAPSNGPTDGELFARLKEFVPKLTDESQKIFQADGVALIAMCQARADLGQAFDDWFRKRVIAFVAKAKKCLEYNDDKARQLSLNPVRYLGGDPAFDVKMILELKAQHRTYERVAPELENKGYLNENGTRITAPQLSQFMRANGVCFKKFKSRKGEAKRDESPLITQLRNIINSNLIDQDKIDSLRAIFLGKTV